MSNEPWVSTPETYRSAEMFEIVRDALEAEYGEIEMWLAYNSKARECEAAVWLRDNREPFVVKHHNPDMALEKLWDARLSGELQRYFQS